MSSKQFLLDTHVWVRYINGESPLKQKAIETIDLARRTGDAFVSVISVWEIALLVRKGRLDLPFGVEHGSSVRCNCLVSNCCPSHRGSPLNPFNCRTRSTKTRPTGFSSQPRAFRLSLCSRATKTSFASQSRQTSHSPSPE